MPALRAASASVSFADDNMAALGSSEAVFTRPYEGLFRASALVVEAGDRFCLITVDAMKVYEQTSRAAAARIAAESSLPADNILICATHTHSAPTTTSVLGFQPNREYVRRIEEGCVQAALAACAELDKPGPSSAGGEAELLYGVVQEDTVGRNSRLLLKDGMVGWYGYGAEDAVRPTGPFDPDLHVLALKRKSGGYAGIAFNYSTHNIGAIRKGVLSPAVFALAAHEVERSHGATALYLPGAIGSSHNNTCKGGGVPPDESVRRVVAAVEQGLAEASPMPVGALRILNRPFRYKVREFDEAEEDAAVKCYAEKYIPEQDEEWTDAFRGDRAKLARLSGQERETCIMGVRLGDLALVGVPCELFAKLGLDLRARSCFPKTCIVGLANDDLGYMPDRQAYADGGYQTWPAFHSIMAPGTGEALVEQALEMLGELRGGR